MEKFAQGFKKVQKVFSVLIGAALFLMIAIVFLQTVCRAFKISLTWSASIWPAPSTSLSRSRSSTDI